MKKGKIFVLLGCAVLFFAAIGTAYYISNVINKYNSPKNLNCADIFTRTDTDYFDINETPSDIFVVTPSDALGVSRELASFAKVKTARMTVNIDTLKISDFFDEFQTSGMDDINSFMILKKVSFISRAHRLYTNRQVCVYTDDQGLAKACEKHGACDIIFTKNGAKQAKTSENKPYAPDMKSNGTVIKTVLYSDADGQSYATVNGESYRMRVDEGNCVPDKTARLTARVTERLNDGEYDISFENAAAKLYVEHTAVTYGKIAEITTDFAETVTTSGKNWGEGKYSPVNTPLPRGTTDMIVSEKDGMCLLSSTHTLYKSTDAKGEVLSVREGSLPPFNTVALCGITQTDRKDTRFAFSVDYKAPFRVDLWEQGYVDLSCPDPRPDGSVNGAEFEHIDIRFFYSSAVFGDFNIPTNSIFKSAEWIYENGDFTLRLNLKEKGGFYGYHAEYNKDGNLEFTFNEPPQTLESAIVMLDAGHGGEDSGAVSGDGTIHEDRLNLALTNRIKERLKKQGITVVMTRTENDSEPTLEQRALSCFKTMPDLFVSIHRNASENTTATGYYNYYFYPWSQPFAKSVFYTAASMFKANNVEYYPFYVTRVTECPAILTENGFVSNPDEAKTISDEKFDSELADKTVEGIVNYLKNSMQR